MGQREIDSSGSKYGTIAGSCEGGTEPSIYVNFGKFLRIWSSAALPKTILPREFVAYVYFSFSLFAYNEFHCTKSSW
jgi:hypothetical protein